MPKITVCIPTFNRVQLLPYAIESVLNQSEPDFELIICDDGSTDSTFELMSKYTDNRIKYIRHKQNIGKSNNMRSGFEVANGEYFIKFDMEYRLHQEQEGINRAIPYLYDKIRYLEKYKFASDKLEKYRQNLLGETQLLLGLRLIEKGEIQKGRELVARGKSFSITKALIGLSLSFLPFSLRNHTFNLLRQVRG